MAVSPASAFDLHTVILSIVSTGAGAKILLMAARTMPAPPSSCGFFCRWVYDFIQAFGDNTDKIGSTRPDAPVSAPITEPKSAEVSVPSAKLVESTKPQVA